MPTTIFLPCSDYFRQEKLQFQFERLYGDSHMSTGPTTQFFMPNMALAQVWWSFVAIEKIAFCTSSTQGSVWN